MSQSLSKLIVHITFCVKNRRRTFLTPKVREMVNRYMAGILKNIDCHPVAVGCSQDHIHIACVQSKNIGIAKIVEEVKKNSSKWIKTIESERRDPALMKFSWQGGYAAFSVSQSNVEKVIRYIENQEEHHRRVSFQEEYRLFLEKHAVDYDEKYMWD